MRRLRWFSAVSAPPTVRPDTAAVLTLRLSLTFQLQSFTLTVGKKVKIRSNTFLAPSAGNSCHRGYCDAQMLTGFFQRGGNV